MTDRQPNPRLLQEIVHRESRSFLQYASESFPWTTTEEQAALEPLQKLVAEEREATAALGRYLARSRQAAPYLGSYPMAFTSVNFLSLEHLLPMLVRDTRSSYERLEKDLNEIAEPVARSIVHDLLDTKRRHLEALQALAAAYPETHSTVR